MLAYSYAITENYCSLIFCKSVALNCIGTPDIWSSVKILNLTECERIREWPFSETASFLALHSSIFSRGYSSLCRLERNRLPPFNDSCIYTLNER